MLPLGTRIADRYALEALLGVGGMGEVYVAFDMRLERERSGDGRRGLRRQATLG